MLAAANNFIDVAQVLIDKGASTEAKDNVMKGVFFYSRECVRAINLAF